MEQQDVGRTINLSLPSAIKVPALVVIYRDEEGVLKGSVRFDPSQGVTMGECLSHLSQVIIDAVEQHRRERQIAGVLSLIPQTES